MIGQAKAIAKRHWPSLRLRTILLMTFVFVAALPGVGAVFLRVYENSLVRQTEAELVAQGAALVAAAEAAWPGAGPRRLAPPGPRDYRPEPPRIDLNDTPILPERPDARIAAAPIDPRLGAAARDLEPVIRRTQRTTLASIQLLDRGGRILTGPLAGRRYAHVPEVDAALAGRARTVLRHNDAYQRRYPLEWLSRASDIRIHHVRPVFANGEVAGALLLSRSPRALFRGIYQDRAKIMIGIAAIFATLLVLSGLLSRGIARPIEELSAATRGLAQGHGEAPPPPATAAIEIQALYRDFAAMAEAIERRSRYLRDFAHAVSHEFKTPLAAIRGGIELLQDHHATMAEDERRRFLANIETDADRLAQLVTRLLDLARADMARPQAGAATALAPIVEALARERTAIAIVPALPADLPPVAVPAATLQAVLTTLIDNAAQAGATAVTIGAEHAGSGVAIDVSDDGPGITEADRARIFEPFFTSRRASGGSGLGLPIARSLLAASGGTIEAIPAARGAAFRITLPAG